MDAVSENAHLTAFLGSKQMTMPSERTDKRALQSRDVNLPVYQSHHGAKNAPTRPGVDTPPPSSPILASVDRSNRGQRSSSVTAFLSSSPGRAGDSPSPDELHDAALQPLPGSSPVKPTRARSSFGPSHAVITFKERKDPHAGLQEIEGGKDVNGVSHVLFGSYTHALMLGRSKPTGLPHAAALAEESQETNTPPVQNESGIGAKPIQHVPLPNTARHVSRRHAIVEWVPFSLIPGVSDDQPSRLASGAFVVRILGQNGLIIEGKRRREGHVFRLVPGKSVIDFFGVKTKFELHPEVHIPQSIQTLNEDIHRAKRARTSGAGQDGSSPAKGQKLHRSASLHTLGASASQDAVSQLLQESKPTRSAFVRKPSGPGGSVLPPSPPTSSPPPFGADHQSLRSSPDPREGEYKVSEPTSPSLGRSRTQNQLLPGLKVSRPTVAGRTDDDVTGHAQSQRLRALMADTDDGQSDADGDSMRPTKTARADDASSKKEAHGLTEASSDAESDLTPTSSPVLEPLRPSAANTERAQPTKTKSRSLKPTNSQIMMPPPKLPASAVQPKKSQGTPAADVNNAGAGSESLRISLRDQARACVAQIAPTYDLEGLLAGAIVFHRTATISASEAVRSVLSSNQGLMRGEVGTLKHATHEGKTPALKQGQVIPGWGAHDLLVKSAGLSASSAAERWSSMARRAWTERLEMVLQSKRMFGQIQRAGKDASGNSLECWYYYDKEGDEDLERAANLGALVKPIRGALKTHKPIFWKKSRSAEEDASAANMMTMAAAATSLSSSISSASPTASKDAWDLGDSQIGPAIVTTPLPAFTASSAAASVRSPSGSPCASPRLKIDERRIWEETQPEEREKTWDRVGDQDWTARSSSPSLSHLGGGSAGSTGKRKRK